MTYLTLHKEETDIIISFLAISGHDKQKMVFIQPNEIGIEPEIFDQWRSSSIEDLALFLQLRAEELCDHGEGLFLMVGGNGPPVGFVGGPNGSIFREAFENVAKDPKYKKIRE